MSTIVELRVVVEKWTPEEPLGHHWHKRYSVQQQMWRKRIEMPSVPCKCQTMAPSRHDSHREVENVHFDLTSGVYEVDLERYEGYGSQADDIEAELSADGWEPYPWDGDFGE